MVEKRYASGHSLKIAGGGGGDGIKGLTDDSNEGKGVGQRMKESIQGLTGSVHLQQSLAS